MNKQPYTTPPRWWPPKLTPRCVRLSRRYRRWQLRSKQQVQEVQVRGQEHLLGALAAGHGVLITPNHPAHYDSAALYLAADQLDVPLYFMTAWQVFGMSSRFERIAMQRLGCFSIDRENADRRAYKQAVDILQNERYPLVIFPEGDIYHITDRVTPFREGAAAITLAAARRSSRPIVVVPCGIKFWYVDDPLPGLLDLMSRLEEKLLLRPEPNRELPDRIYRFAGALLALKEIDYLGSAQSGVLSDRINRLAESILQKIESRHSPDVAARQIPQRVKELRRKIIQNVGQCNAADTNQQPRIQALSRDMDDLFVVMQLFSYPGDYLPADPTVERLAETIDKFEEDVFQKELPTVHGRRRVEVCFGPPIPVPAGSQGRGGVAGLSNKMQSLVQELVTQLNDAIDTIRSAKDEPLPNPKLHILPARYQPNARRKSPSPTKT